MNQQLKVRQKLHFEELKKIKKKNQEKLLVMKSSESGSPKILKKFQNDTGTLVMFALKAFEEPATFDQLVSLIAGGKKVSKLLL